MHYIILRDENVQVFRIKKKRDVAKSTSIYEFNLTDGSSARGNKPRIGINRGIIL